MKNILMLLLLVFPFMAQADEAPVPPQNYVNPLSQINFPVPEGFSLSNSNETSAMFLGPRLDGGLLSIHINVFPIPAGVDAKLMYSTNLNSYKANTLQYAYAKEFDLGAAAFEAEERGKSVPTEMHRRLLMIWNNGYQTNVMMAGPYSAMGQFKEMNDNFFKSISILGVEKKNAVATTSDLSVSDSSQPVSWWRLLINWCLSFFMKK